MAGAPVLQLRGVRKTYGELVAVDLLDLEVQPGECVALIGQNGSGKTTTLRLVAGLLEPTDGEVTVAGDSLGLTVRGLRSPSCRTTHCSIPI